MSAIISALSNSDAEAEEWRLRCDMAAVFRISARLNWNEQIGNHNSLMLPQRTPDEKPTFLINARGWRFEELTASNLIVCDLDGNVIRGKGELRKVAFHIHARIHLANPNAACVIHVHPRYLTALSMLADPEVTRTLISRGFEPQAMTPTAWGGFITRETARWGDLIRSANLKSE